MAEPGLAQVIREVMPSSRSAVRLNLDATYVGNAAHFINHRSAGCTLHQLLHVLSAAARWISGSPQAVTTCSPASSPTLSPSLFPDRVRVRLQL